MLRIFADNHYFAFSLYDLALFANLHEGPSVPNFGTAGKGARLVSGMTIAIEPMVNIGSSEVYELADGWTVKTKDRTLSAHYENTVVLTSDGVICTTLVDKDW